MKKLYICILFLFMVDVIAAQDNDCSEYKSDNAFFRYTAYGCQEVLFGNHSKAINESRKMANICAECELAKMVNSAVTRVAERMTSEGDAYSEIYIDTSLVSTYKYISGIKTVCQSETKLIGNMYVTYITKEISIDNISDMFYFRDDDNKQKFRKLLEKENR